MFYGFAESESFEDPRLLNKFKHHKVVVERRSDGNGFWHIFILEISNEDIKRTLQMIATVIKADWNAIFFNEKIVYAVFKDKIFTLKREKNWQSPDYLQVIKYAKDHNVGDMNFNDVFDHYKRLL